MVSLLFAADPDGRIHAPYFIIRFPQSFQWSASLKDGCWDGSMLVVGEGEGVALLMTAENYDQRTFAPSTGSHHSQSLHGDVVFIWLSWAWENTIFRENRRANTILRKKQMSLTLKSFWISHHFFSGLPCGSCFTPPASFFSFLKKWWSFDYYSQSLFLAALAALYLHWSVTEWVTHDYRST